MCIRDRVRDVLAKMKRDGLAATLQTVRSRLAQPQSVGYSSAGVVLAVGDGVADINVGAVSYTHLDVYKRQLSHQAQHLATIYRQASQGSGVQQSPEFS